MKQIPFHHPSSARSPTFKNGSLVHPGETIMIDVPESTLMVDPPTTDGAYTTPLEELLKLPIRDIVPQLADFDIEQLKAVLSLENASANPRSTLISELEETILELETNP